MQLWFYTAECWFVCFTSLLKASHNIVIIIVFMPEIRKEHNILGTYYTHVEIPTKHLAFHSILSSFAMYSTCFHSFELHPRLFYFLLNCSVGWRVEAAPHVTGWTDAYPNIHTITGFGYYSLQTDYDDDEDSSDLVALPVP